MANQINLDLLWANQGGKTDPTDSKWEDGWIAEIPTYQNFNYVLHATESNLLHLAENGAFQWQTEINYEKGTLVRDGGFEWFCITANSGNKPSDDNTNSYWTNGKIVGRTPVTPYTQKHGLYVANVNDRTLTTWTGNDVTLENDTTLVAFNTTSTATDNLIFGNIGGELVVVDVGNAVVPDNRTIALTDSSVHRLYHEGHPPTQSEVSGTVPEAPTDGKLYSRKNTNWVKASATDVQTQPPPPNTGSGGGWYNLDDGQLYVDVDDGNSSQWVPASPPVIPSSTDPNALVNGTASNEGRTNSQNDNRFMEVGAYGLGENNSLSASDFNDVTLAGYYFRDVAAGGNAPDSARSWMVTHTCGVSLDWASQLAQGYGGGHPNNTIKYMTRIKEAGNWGPWREILTEERIGTNGGDIMQVGAFGLGIGPPPQEVDANNQTTPSVEFWTSGSTNLPAANSFIVTISAGSVATNDRVVQQATDYSSGTTYIRALDSQGNWTSWGKVLTSANIGTVEGDLVTVGDYGIGLGQDSINVDADTRLTPAVERWNTGSTNTPADGNTQLVTISSGSSGGAYPNALVKQQSTGVYLGRSFERYSVDTGSSWTAWKEMLTSDMYGTSNGDIVTVGDYGIGNSTTVDDANDAITNGWYEGGGSSGTNFNTDFNGRYGSLFVTTRSTNQIFQTNHRDGNIAMRESVDTGATWTEWANIFTNNNLKPDVFSGGFGFASGSSTVRLLIPNLQAGTASSITVTGSFDLYDMAGSNTNTIDVNDISLNSASSTQGQTHIIVSVANAFTLNQPYWFRPQGNAQIKVNI
jgi:hypothetical protein